MIAQLDTVLNPIHESAVSIEGSFLRAGDGLSRGLGTFEALKANTAEIGDQISRGGMESAVSLLGQLSRELTTTSDTLPRDRATLEELVRYNKLVAFHIEKLMENMRMMTILARSARIEAVVFDRNGDGFVDFTQEIMALTRHVQSDIERCAHDHQNLSGLIGAALKAQLSLERLYRGKLLDVARELDHSQSEIVSRQATGADLMRDVVRRADSIASAARTAIMSLQAGDSTRQRLEHVHRGLSYALDDNREAAEMDDDRDALIAAMCRLQRAQLSDTVRCFGEDIGSIDGALRLLAEETRDIVALGRGVYGDGAARGGVSFLDAIKGRLAKAAEHIGTCEAGRVSVAKTVASLCAMIVGLNTAVSALSGVVPEIVLIGVNAGLKAGRLGTAGRSVVVIADTLKELATTISEGTKTLLPIFSTLQTVSGHLASPTEQEPGCRTVLAQNMGAILAALEVGSGILRTFLTRLEQDASRFEADLDQSRRDFAQNAAMNVEMLAATDLLRQVEIEATRRGVDPVKAFTTVDAITRPTYTMAREREIHAEIVGMAA